MIRVEISECVEPLNKFFEKGKYYMVVPSKSDGWSMTAFAEPNKGFGMRHNAFIRTSCPQHHLYFKPVFVIHLENYKRVNEYKKRPMEDILKEFGVIKEEV